MARHSSLLCFPFQKQYLARTMLMIAFVQSWRDLVPDAAQVRAAYIAPLKGTLFPGECITFAPPVSHGGRSFCHGRILEVVTFSSVKVQLLCYASLVNEIGAPEPPVRRSHVAYPAELVFTNLVSMI